jgi:hypothetical protein
MAGRPSLPSSGELFPPLPLSYRAALAAPSPPERGATLVRHPAPPAPMAGHPAPPPPSAGSGGPASAAPPPAGLALMAGSPVPPPPSSGSGPAGAQPASATPLPPGLPAPDPAAPPPAPPAPPALPSPAPLPGPAGSGFAGACPASISLLRASQTTVLGHDDALLLPLVFPGGTIGTAVYSQPSAITSTMCAPSPSDDAATILAATRAAVAAARQRAQDAARALEQEQAVVDAIERQYAETYRRLASKGVSDGSPMSARHSADTFEPAPVPALTLRASLHAQAAALTSIRATVTDVLTSDSTQYPRWRDQVLQTLRRYALADHVLPTVAAPTEDWLLMDEVVLSWIHGTLTAKLQDIVRVPDDTAHHIWGAPEAQFLDNRQTRILYLETAFRQLVQGDLSVDEYYRQMKTMADTLRTLGAPMTDESLVLNLLCGLSPRFDRVAPILTRMKPFPTFAEAKNDLLLEELRLSAAATTAPATALYSAPRAAPSDSGGVLLPALRPRCPLELRDRLLASGALAAANAAVVARADAVAVACREAVVAPRVALSGHPSTTRGLAPFTCGPGCPRVPRPLAPPPLSRSSLPLHPRRHPWLLPSLGRYSIFHLPRPPLSSLFHHCRKRVRPSRHLSR